MLTGLESTEATSACNAAAALFLKDDLVNASGGLASGSRNVEGDVIVVLKHEQVIRHETREITIYLSLDIFLDRQKHCYSL